jgi:hypothetical protein
MATTKQVDESIVRLQEEFGWTEEEARRFRRRAGRLLVDDIVGVPPLTAAERRELGLDLKVGDEIDEDDEPESPTGQVA